MSVWEVDYDNHSQNPVTWDNGTDEIEADTILVRDGALKFTDTAEETVAVYAPGYWAKARRRTE